MVMAKFKCKLSGNIFEFFNDFDIEDMREHEQYEEVLEEDKATVAKKETVVAKKKTKKEAK